MADLVNAQPHKKAECRRCGTCCRKGGPALHSPDGELISEGVLRARDLCTFRPGELVRDDTLGRIVPLPGELVKIAAPYGVRPDDWTCRFLTEKNLCFIHGRQPIECRAFYCEAPEALLALSGKDSLDRKTVRGLLGAPAWWDELMDAHSERCSYDRLTELAPRIAEDEEARRAFLEIVEYDRAFRDLIVEKKAALPEELDFLLGRPLLRIVIMYGLDARVRTDGGISLVQTSRNVREEAKENLR